MFYSTEVVCDYFKLCSKGSYHTKVRNTQLHVQGGNRRIQFAVYPTITPGILKKSESDVRCSYHITATSKTRVLFTDLYLLLLLDNERSVESFGIQLQTISETVEPICISAQDSTSHFEISRSPKAKEMSSPETVKTKKGENENVHSESTEGSSVCVSKQETVVVEESKAEEQKTTEDQRKDDSMFHSDYRFRLRLRVRYRINEEAIRCLLLLRWVG